MSGITTAKLRLIIVGFTGFMSACDANEHQGTVSTNLNLEPDLASVQERPFDAPAETTVPEIEAIEHVNAIRAAVNLAPFQLSNRLSWAAEAHAEFLVTHHQVYDAEQISAHLQPTGLSGYIATTFVDRIERSGYQGSAFAEVVARRPNPIAAIESWMESLYHRLPLLTTEASDLGYGQARRPGSSANVIELGRSFDMGEDVSTPTWVAYPYPEQREAAFEWDGNEVPQPRAPPQGYPSGPVITLQTPLGQVSFDSATIVDEQKQALPATHLHERNDSALSPGQSALIPHQPLNPSSTYTVTFRGSLDGNPFTKSWSFTTRVAGCELFNDTCGPGRACYVGVEGPACQWEGIRNRNQPCAYVNECRAGLSCVAGLCEPLCDPDPSSDYACERMCKHHVPLLGGYNACVESSCAGSDEQCGKDMACYWAGDFLCGAAGAAPLGAPCEAANDCSPGLACLGQEGHYQCHALCGGEHYPSCQQTCEGARTVLDTLTQISACSS